MIISMTGYGQGLAYFQNKTIRVEIRTLNARTTESRSRMPNVYRDKEMEVRKWMTDELSRGKIDISISVEQEVEGDDGSMLNHNLFKKYYNELFTLKQTLGIEGGDMMQAVLSIPNVMVSYEELAPEEEWKVVQSAIGEALADIKKFRLGEGKILEREMVNGVEKIEKYLEEIVPFEEARLPKVREKLRKALDEFLVSQQVDHNRFEQELIYYIEKLDITEEKVRLAQHCMYFKNELNNTEELKGKKLGFIAQEMGREINTLSAKAQRM
ncbi:MAG: YicC family protein [Saprospiraceae bacterium]|nr:YicC family protein [Saprospiraceae bacterium]